MYFICCNVCKKIKNTFFPFYMLLCFHVFPPDEVCAVAKHPDALKKNLLCVDADYNLKIKV